MPASLKIIRDIIEQAGVVHLPGGEAEITAGLRIPAVVRLEPGRPLAVGVAVEQARQPGNPNIDVVSSHRHNLRLSIENWEPLSL